MLDPAVHIELRIVGVDGSSDAQGRLHQAGCARTRAAGAACCTACAGARSSGAEAADASAGRSLHDAGIDAAETCAGLGAKDVGICDRQVVARDCQVEIVFKRQVDGILQR